MIKNNTRLNTSLFTYLSSGGPDYYLNSETSENDKNWDINELEYQNIPNGNRYTLFLNQLYTNYFLLDLNMLSNKKLCIVSFYTTKEFSFSLTRFGNKSEYVNGDIYLTKNASKWGLGNIRNLEQYFSNYEDNKILFFQFYIYKPTSYQYYIDVQVIDPDTTDTFITNDDYTLTDKLEYIIICNK